MAVCLVVQRVYLAYMCKMFISAVRIAGSSSSNQCVASAWREGLVDVLLMYVSVEVVSTCFIRV